VIFDPQLRRRVALGVFAVLLSFVPLVGTLGYFSALVLGPIMAVLGIAGGVDAVRRARTIPAPSRPGPADGSVTRLAASGWADFAWLAGLPLAVLTVSMLYNRNCDPWGGLQFYFMGPVASLAIGWTSGTWAGVIGRRRWGQIGLGLLPMAVSVSIGLAILYTQPVVYAYDAWVGWFSGPIYDEVVSVRRTYMRFRLYNGFVVAAAWCCLSALVDGELKLRPASAIGRGADRWRLVTAALCLAGAVYMGHRPTRWGFTTTHASTERTLPATAESEHFVIHYRPGTATEREIEWVAAEHEFAWHRLERKLGRAPHDKITSYVFPNPKVKRNVFGAGRVEVSLPWKREMYLRHLTFPHDILHHELAHAFGATIGDRLFGLSAGMTWRGPTLNMGLVEGFAVAMAPRSRHGLDIHDQAAVLDRLDKRPRLGPIMGLGFFGKPSGRAYTAAGSFVSWLLETRGPDPLAKVYRSAGNFEDAYGESLESLEKQWIAFLRDRPIRDEDVAMMEARFKEPVIFARPCAHKTATVLGDAARAARNGDGDEAVSLLESLCEMEPEQPKHRLALSGVQATLGRLDDAAETLEDAAQMPKLPQTTRAAIESVRGDVALVAQDYEVAAAAYARAADLSNGEAIQRSLDIKRRSARDPGATPIIIDYFRPFLPDDDTQAASIVQMHAAMRMKERAGWWAIGNYLLARQILNSGRPDLARPHLEACLGLAGEAPEGESLLEGTELVEAARIALVDARLRTGDYEGARELVEVLAAGPDVRSGDLLDLQLWRERIDFYEGYVGDVDSPSSPR